MLEKFCICGITNELSHVKQQNNKVMITNNLAFSTKEINSTFKIKVAGLNEDGKKLNTLVGVSGLIKLIGLELANKFFKRAFKGLFDMSRIICKLRRGLKITFYAI